MPTCNDDDGDGDEIEGTLPIFKHLDRPYGRSKSKRLSDNEYEAALTYVMLNCEDVDRYVK